MWESHLTEWHRRHSLIGLNEFWMLIRSRVNFQQRFSKKIECLQICEKTWNLDLLNWAASFMQFTDFITEQSKFIIHKKSYSTFQIMTSTSLRNAWREKHFKVWSPGVFIIGLFKIINCSCACESTRRKNCFFVQSISSWTVVKVVSFAEKRFFILSTTSRLSTRHRWMQSFWTTYLMTTKRKWEEQEACRVL